jgi:hypothetical protein
MKPFTPEEALSHKESLADLSIKIEDIEERKKAVIANLKFELKPLLEEYHKAVSNIKQKAEYVNELCYKFVDRDTKQTGYYNSEGDLVEVRQATIDELQPLLFINQKTGTDN